MALRTQGVNIESNPTKKKGVVLPSRFDQGGLFGFAERQYKKVFDVTDLKEFEEIFGIRQLNSFLYDCAEGFFLNADGAGKLFIKTLLGNTGSAIDAVVASKTVQDQGPDDLFTAEAAYKDEQQYGASGNRHGYYTVQADRFTTAAAAQTLAAGTSAQLDSVIGFRVGDIVRFEATGAGGATVYHKITAIDFNTNTISWTGVFHATATLEIDDVVAIPGFEFHTVVKTVDGIITEVETELGGQVLSTESEVAEFYFVNVMKQNKKIRLTDDASASTLGDRIPSNQGSLAAPEFLENGSDGTTLSTATQFNFELSEMDDKPARFMAHCETVDVDANKGLISYSTGREDRPKVIVNFPSDQDADQLEDLGHKYQVASDANAGGWAQHIEIVDPFTSNPNAPRRVIPNVGDIIGLYVRVVRSKGVHFIPATIDATLRRGSVENQDHQDKNKRLESKALRTRLAEAGVNVINFVQGQGMRPMSAYTFSTTTEFKFFNGIVMREFIKLSAQESLASSENTPNAFNRIESDRLAILNFYYNLWNRGSNGQVPEGETFGQGIDDSGNPTSATDHFEVKANSQNNTPTDLQNGERNLDSWFTFPAPAASIRIGVGFILR